MKRRAWVAGLVLAALLNGCLGEPRRSPELVVSAAASLSDLLTEAARTFEEEERSVQVRLNFGSSGALSHQIERGAPVDLFIAAAAEPVDRLVEKGLVDRAAVRVLARNQVVLIRSKAAGTRISDWADLPRASRVAIGNPRHVPAGQYGREILERLNLWERVEPKLVLAEDVRQVLQYVASGEAEAGIVYRTDAAAAQGVEVVAAAPPGSHPPVVYPAAILKEARHPELAERLVAFLRSDRGREILARHGFTPAE